MRALGAQAALAGRRPSRRAVTRQAPGCEQLLHSPDLSCQPLDAPAHLPYNEA